MLDKVCIKFDLIDREIQSLMTDLLHYRDSEMRREVREQDGKHDDVSVYEYNHQQCLPLTHSDKNGTLSRI